MLHHHDVLHYARPIGSAGGVVAAFLMLWPTRFSAASAIFSLTLAFRFCASSVAFSHARSRVSPIARFSYSLAGTDSPLTAPTTTAIAPAAIGFSVTKSSTVLAALPAALRARIAASRAFSRAESAYSPTVSRALDAYSPTVCFAVDAYS